MKPRKLELGTKNIIGHKVTQLRLERKMKQKDLAAKLQTYGADINLSSLSKLEGQTRPVSDIEIKALAQIFSISADELLDI
ncbi:MAG: helix-turn-helix transcriptional regulator [Firmicutes bacterium]|nr:helix-turn-helix transcriptional regulator [Bacillota bacterium]